MKVLYHSRNVYSRKKESKTSNCYKIFLCLEFNVICLLAIIKELTSDIIMQGCCVLTSFERRQRISPGDRCFNNSYPLAKATPTMSSTLQGNKKVGKNEGLLLRLIRKRYGIGMVAALVFWVPVGSLPPVSYTHLTLPTTPYV